MKTVKITLSIVVLLAFLGFNETFGQWAPDGANIHNTNAGNVGIGNFPAATLLHVGKNMVEPTIRVHNLGGAGGATFQMMDMVSGADWKFKATNTGGFKIRDNAFALDVIQVEPNSRANSLYIDNDGLVGIGTPNPLNDIHVYGSYPFVYLDNNVIGNSGLSFMYEGAFKGWIYYNDSEDHLILNAESGGGWRTDLIIKSDGRVCIGTSTPAAGYALSVNGKGVFTEVLVEAVGNWPDYVFGEGYQLMSLQELKKSIKENRHLPGMPSAGEVSENGILLADMQKKFLEKLEELTLYTIQQDEQIAELQMKVATLEKANLKKTRMRK